MPVSRFPQGPFIDYTTNYPTLEWVLWLQNPTVTTIVFETPVDVPSGGTGLTSGTSGGILGFTSSTTLASSALLQANHIVVGGGAGDTPSTLASNGTTTQVLHGNDSGQPFFDELDLSADVTGVLAIENGGTNSAEVLDGQAIMVSDGVSIIQGPKGISTKVLHGNASGIPQYGFVLEDDQFLSDVTTWDVSETAHGYVPKAPGDPTMFLDGEGNWSEVQTGSWIPLVDGAEPPGFITDGTGSLMLVAYGP